MNALAVSLDGMRAMITIMQLRISCGGNALTRHAIDVYNNMSLSLLLIRVKYDEQCDALYCILFKRLNVRPSK